MNNTILNLEKRKTKVLRMRTEYLFTCDKEQENFTSMINRFDIVIERIVKSIKHEWDKYYQKN